MSKARGGFSGEFGPARVAGHAPPIDPRRFAGAGWPQPPSPPAGGGKSPHFMRQPQTMISMPASATALPVRSQAVGRTPSTSHSQAMAVAT